MFTRMIGVMLLAFVLRSEISGQELNYAITELIEKLKDSDADVRLNTVKSLAKLKAKAKPAIDLLKTLAEKDESPEIRQEAVTALAAIKAGQLEETLERLKKDLKTTKLTTRVEAMDEIIKLGKVAEPLKGILVEMMLEPSEKVRGIAGDALVKVDSEFHAAVTSLLFDSLRDSRTGSAKSEGMSYLTQNPSQIPAAVPALKAYYVRSVKNGYSLDSVGPNAGYPAQALKLLARTAPSDPFVVREVLGLTGNPQSIGRGVGISLINDIHAKPDIKVTALMYAAAVAQHRQAAVTALGTLGPDARAALPMLNKFKLDTDSTVREAARVAVEAIQKK